MNLEKEVKKVTPDRKNHGKRPAGRMRGKSILPKITCKSEECKDKPPRVPFFWVDFVETGPTITIRDGKNIISRSVASVTTNTKMICRNCGAILFKGEATAYDPVPAAAQEVKDE